MSQSMFQKQISHRALSSTRAVIALAVVGALSACEKKDQQPAGETAAAVAPAPATPAPVAAPSNVITEAGYNALRPGMTFAEANDSLKGALKPAAGANLAECDYVKWEGGPEGLLVMIVDNKIARIDITRESTIATDVGAKIGDTEEQIKSLYGARVAVTPHKYDDGHYLHVKSANASDSSHAIVFETVKGKVTRYRTGTVPAVGFVEGCS